MALCCLITVMVAHAQNDGAAMAPADSVAADSTDVVAYFCNRDTMEYRLMATKKDINGNDTVWRSAYAIDFMLCITDSTADGYRMEYVATDFVRMDTISADAQALMHQRVFERIKGKRLVFQLSEVGEVLAFVNWSDIRDDVIQGIFTAYNEFYPKIPGLEELVPKGQLMGIVSQSYQTEEGLMGWFKEIELLFNAHGRSYAPMTETEDEGSDTEFPSSSIVVAGLEKTGNDGDKDAEFDDDYYVMAETETRLKGDDIKTFFLSKGAVLGEGNMLSKTIAELHADDIADKEVVVDDGYYLHLFFNGWPKSMESRNEEIIGDAKTVEDRSVDWLSRSWNNF